MTLQDRLGRPLGTLRLSLTDRCNLRCDYCMPEETYAWLPKQEILSLEEKLRLVSVFAALGVRRFRLTGGEPLLRQGCVDFVRRMVKVLAPYDNIDLAMTTNAVLLADKAQALRDAGLERLTISLDTLDPARFARLTRRSRLQEVHQGLHAAQEAGFEGTKLNAVIIKGFNDDEVVPLLDFALAQDLQLRYIEYMDVGGATGWSQGQVFSSAAILETIAAAKGELEAIPMPSRSTAQGYRLRSGQIFGIIASTTEPFCGGCDRSRVSADGTWFHCLYAHHGLPLGQWLRQESDDRALSETISQHWQRRQDQGARERLHVQERGPLVPMPTLRANPRLEMHTRGG